MSNIDRLSKIDLDHRARVVIDWYDSTVGDRPRAVPVLSICERLHQMGKLKLVLGVDLGVSESGRKVRGLFDSSNLLVAIDQSLDPSGPQFQFTLAHELGHFVLHRRYALSEMDIDAKKSIISDTRRDFYLGRQLPRSTDREWMEWQANTFAEALLLPELSFRKTVSAVQRDMGINKHLGEIYINRTPQSHADYRMITSRLLEHFHVSRTLVVRRLWNLGIVLDFRDSLKHTSRLFDVADAT